MARPKFEITDEVIKKAEAYAATGLTKEEIADCLGICYDTLNEKSKINSEFAEAIKRGKAKGIGMMANNLVRLAQGGNAAANIFFMKARAKWKEGDEDPTEILNKANEALTAVKILAEKCLQNNNK